MKYALFLNGVDISASLPPWLSWHSDESEPKIEIYTWDPADEGLYTVTVMAYLEMNPVNRFSDTQIDLVFDLVLSTCFETTFNDPDAFNFYVF